MNTTPVTAREIISLLKSAIATFETDLKSVSITVAHDDTNVRTSTADYSVRGGDPEGLGLSEIMSLKECLGINDLKLVIESPNNGQGDLRYDTIYRYMTNIPFVVYEECCYSEAWHGQESWVRLVIDHSFGQETTGMNKEIKLNIKKIDDLHKQIIDSEVNQIIKQISEKREDEFEILLWKDDSLLRRSTSDYSVQDGGREGISEAVELALIVSLGVDIGSPIDCSDARQAEYDNDFRTLRIYTPTSIANLYIYSEEQSGGWHGYTVKHSVVKIKNLPPTLDYNESTYYNGDEVENQDELLLV